MSLQEQIDDLEKRVKELELQSFPKSPKIVDRDEGMEGEETNKKV